jgi:hypothetical protein
MVSLDDGADCWQVLVFTSHEDDARAIARIAYKEKIGEEPPETIQVGVTKLRVPMYFWRG